MLGSAPFRRTLRRTVFVLLVLTLVFVLAVGWKAWQLVRETSRSTPVFSPPVLAGQYLAYGCSGGVYARTAANAIVLTTTGHCMSEGTTAVRSDGTPIGTASAWSNWPTCDKPGKNRCTASDMATITLVPGAIPWGHLDQIDLGAGGYVTVAPGTQALACPEMQNGDPVAFNGRGIFRTGRIVAQEVYNFDGDGTFFPCMVISDVQAGGGDSGGVVLVRGIPGGVAAREFGQSNALGFTPLGPGLEELHLTLCDSPNCGLTPATATNR